MKKNFPGRGLTKVEKHWYRGYNGERCFVVGGRVQTERDGKRAETRFVLPAKRTGPFISAGVSVQSSTGFLGMRVGRERL